LACSADTFAEPDASPADSAPPIDTGADVVVPRPDAGGDATAQDGGTPRFCDATVFPNLLFCEDFDTGKVMPPAGWTQVVAGTSMSHAIDSVNPMSTPNRYHASHPATLGAAPNQAILKRTSPLGAPLRIEFEFRLESTANARTEFLRVTPQSSVQVSVAFLTGKLVILAGGNPTTISTVPAVGKWYHGTLSINYASGTAMLNVVTLGSTGAVTFAGAPPVSIEVAVGIVDLEAITAINVVSFDNIVATTN
jgi:hypothetical protein